MSVIDPNNNYRLLVDDFITLAREHLLTVEGLATTTTIYASSLGTPLPGIAKWKGYASQPEKPILDTIIPKLPTQTTNFSTQKTRGLVIEDYNAEAELTGQGVIYGQVKTASGQSVTNSGNTAQTTFVSTNDEAKKAAEAYLGRTMSDTEWNNLVSITYAESTTNQTERAWVMATILNRTRIGYTPLGLRNSRYKFETITDIINQPYQYQPVTGTYANGNSPSKNFINGPNTVNATSIYGAAANILKDVPKTYINFTSNDPRAYGVGTNINYLYQLRANPNSKIIGGTIFAY